jgi:hypothetical protein
MLLHSIVRPTFALMLAATWLLPSCSSSDSGSPQPAAPQEDAAADVQDAAMDQAYPDAQPEAAADVAPEQEAAAQLLQEKEPNDGTTTAEFNALPAGAIMQGAIDKPGDNDIFRFDAAPGKAYSISLSLPSGSLLQPHLTAMDTGRDTHAAGEDYVKIVKSTSSDVSLDLLAMGQGGYFAVVRDARNVSGPTVGGAEYKYTVTVTEVDPKSFEAPALQFPVNLQDKLDRAGGLRLYPFTATEGANAVFDLKATGTMDGRLMVFASSIGSWIARNDDRSVGDPNPLIDAPLSESGAMWLVVENVDETSTDWAYSLQGTLQ